MDTDEALARLLQAQEDAAIAAALGRRGGGASDGDGRARFASLLHDSATKALRYEDELVQAMALSVMPMDQLASAAEEACVLSAAMGECPPLAYEDALAQELLAFFKTDFFKWTNAPPCPTCGAASTAHTGMGAPTPEEAVHGAGRVELYRCTACSSAVRFPRYNDPLKLLETRHGRCGEWANAFTLCCRAAGLDVRLAVDLADHVWTEQWSEAQQKWVHLDPCEAAYDKPLLYEAGWGKRLAYVVAVGRHGAADVTRRYTTRYGEVLQRRVMVPEAWLEGAVQETTARLRAQLAPDERQRLEQRDALERQLLLSGAAAKLAPAELAALPARTTGDAAWLAARGEDGRDGAAAQGSTAGPATASNPATPPPGTRYRLARDDALAAAQPLRLCGGAVRASGDNGPAEAATHAFDGCADTKWLDFGGKARNAAWLEYRLMADAPPAVLGSYALTSANDSPERDPRHVVLEAWSEETQSWAALDEQINLRFPARHHRLELPIRSGAAAPGGSAQPSRRFRLRVVSVADPKAANSVQLACLDLYRQPPQQAQQAQQQEQQREQQARQQEQPQANQHAGPQQAGPQQQQQPPGELPPASVDASAQPSTQQQPASDGQQQAGEGDNPWAALFTSG